MNKKAQAGLEYLMTYGWALVIIATIVGVLVFIVATPPDIVFTSSHPDKLLVKGGSINEGAVQISVQNITGGQIRIVSVELDDQGFIQSIGKTRLNGSEIDGINNIDFVEIQPGGGLILEGIEYTGTGQGDVTIEYKDRFNLDQTTTVSIKGTVNVPAPATPQQCQECESCQLCSDGQCINSTGIVEYADATAIGCLRGDEGCRYCDGGNCELYTDFDSHNCMWTHGYGYWACNENGNCATYCQDGGYISPNGGCWRKGDLQQGCPEVCANHGGCNMEVDWDDLYARDACQNLFDIDYSYHYYYTTAAPTYIERYESCTYSEGFKCQTTTAQDYRLVCACHG